MTSELVVVGGGNMGAALLGGLIAAGRPPQSLAVCEPVAARRDELVTMFPGVMVDERMTPANGAIIAVKPPDVLAATAAAVAAGARRVLSIAAGVTIETLQHAAGADVAVVRAMPNTPALVGQGASAVARAASADDGVVAWATEILAAVGTVEQVSEAQLDAVTALTGSGPAYVFLVAEALIDAAVGAGLPRPLATRLTTQLLVGSSALLAERGDAPALRAMVTSPGGTTAAGLAELERHAVRAALAAAVDAATRRSIELRG